MEKSEKRTQSTKMTISLALPAMMVLNDLTEKTGLGKSAVITLALSSYWNQKFVMDEMPLAAKIRILKEKEDMTEK
jgi:hypothetical protein